MKKVSKIQRQWLGWIFRFHRDWITNQLEVSEKGRIRLQTAYLNEEYEPNGQTQSLLNYVLEEFNKDKELVKKWKKRHGA